jgi:hypothetical protein
MNKHLFSVWALIVVSLFVRFDLPLRGQSADQLIAKNVSIRQTDYKGRSAIRVIATPGAINANSYAVIKDAMFRDGTIEVDLAGQPAAGATGDARGFIGIAFRLQADGSYEYIYLRPTNGRADDQLRRIIPRNTAHTPILTGPDCGRRPLDSTNRTLIWSPVSGQSVQDQKAQLYVNGAAQPCLIVNDLKLPPQPGGVALWIEPATEGYFANLKITAK